MAAAWSLCFPLWTTHTTGPPMRWPRSTLCPSLSFFSQHPSTYYSNACTQSTVGCLSAFHPRSLPKDTRSPRPALSLEPRPISGSLLRTDPLPSPPAPLSCPADISHAALFSLRSALGSRRGRPRRLPGLGVLHPVSPLVREDHRTEGRGGAKGARADLSPSTFRPWV